MSTQPGPTGPLAYGGPVSPALSRLRTSLNRETATCWLLIALTALAVFPLSRLVFDLAFILPAMSTGQLFGSSQPHLGPLGFFGLFATFASTILGVALILLPSVLIVVWALVVNRRAYKLTTRDLVWGSGALCLVEQSFSHVVEEARRQRYRPNPNPVKPGTSFAGHLNHFAYYYNQYYRLSYGPSDLRVPMVVQGNCWLEGTALALSGCLTCACVGVIFLVPLAIRTVLVWPRIIGIKQAAIDYLAGKFDGDLELMARESPPQA